MEQKLCFNSKTEGTDQRGIFEIEHYELRKDLK